MRRSKKESIVLASGNRLLHNGYRESAGMENGSYAVEAAHEWAAGQLPVRQSPQNPAKG